VVLASACLAFLIYNWHPARIFMGDAGSLFLGYLLAVIALKLRTPVPHFASIVAVVLLVGPAVFDTTLVVISRIRNGRKIYIGGTDHTSHGLMLLGFHQVSVTGILVGGTIVSCGLGILVVEGIVNPVATALGALLAGVGTLAFLLRVGEYVDDSHGRGRLVITTPVSGAAAGEPTGRPEPAAPARGFVAISAPARARTTRGDRPRNMGPRPRRRRVAGGVAPAG
jgi:UDP-GlcNAc:undecaprenyl-phosphate/decaprenyl-phosphate GlcNAc-1-phosphate transferase